MELFNPADVPWSTSFDDWALCLVAGGNTQVWVSHDLIAAMVPPGTDRYSMEYHDAHIYIGFKVDALLKDRPGLFALPGMVRPAWFSLRPDIPYRIGNFGGAIFAFLPRPELEARLVLDPVQVPGGGLI